MLAPNELVATGPSTPRAAVVRRVVVVLPLVPETSAIRRPAARWANRSGSISMPSRPPMTDPSPRPVARDRVPAVRDTALASLARNGRRWPVKVRRPLSKSAGVSVTSAAYRPAAPAEPAAAPPRAAPGYPAAGDR